MDAEGAQEEGQDGCNQALFVDFMAQFRCNRREGPVRIGIEAVGGFLLPLSQGAFQGRRLLSPRGSLRVVQALGRQVLGMTVVSPSMVTNSASMTCVNCSS